jgi:LysR family glycine cleavage system transcriptional activator
MTQAAVSYQVKLLEDVLGSALFLRHNRRVSLTETGQRLAAPTTEAFDLLRDAYSAPDSSMTLSISTLVTVASNWLAPRIGHFQMQHPNIAVRMSTEAHSINFKSEAIDLAIRYGDGNWPDLRAHLLMPTAFTPVVSPALLERYGVLETPADLLALPFIDPTDPNLSIWLDEAGISERPKIKNAKVMIGAQTGEAAAAIAGRGIALLNPAFFQVELETGRLVQPFPQVSTNGNGYWLAYPESRRNSPKIAAFRKWVLVEAKAAI